MIFNDNSFDFRLKSSIEVYKLKWMDKRFLQTCGRFSIIRSLIRRLIVRKQNNMDIESKQSRNTAVPSQSRVDDLDVLTQLRELKKEVNEAGYNVFFSIVRADLQTRQRQRHQFQQYQDSLKFHITTDTIDQYLCSTENVILVINIQTRIINDNLPIIDRHVLNHGCHL